jgi:hypothetical protein
MSLIILQVSHSVTTSHQTATYNVYTSIGHTLIYMILYICIYKKLNNRTKKYKAKQHQAKGQAKKYQVKERQSQDASS